MGGFLVGFQQGTLQKDLKDLLLSTYQVSMTPTTSTSGENGCIETEAVYSIFPAPAISLGGLQVAGDAPLADEKETRSKTWVGFTTSVWAVHVPRPTRAH